MDPKCVPCVNALLRLKVRLELLLIALEAESAPAVLPLPNCSLPLLMVVAPLYAWVAVTTTLLSCWIVSETAAAPLPIPNVVLRVRVFPLFPKIAYGLLKSLRARRNFAARRSTVTM